MTHLNIRKGSTSPYRRARRSPLIGWSGSMGTSPAACHSAPEDREIYEACGFLLLRIYIIFQPEATFLHTVSQFCISCLHILPCVPFTWFVCMPPVCIYFPCVLFIPGVLIFTFYSCTWLLGFLCIVLRWVFYLTSEGKKASPDSSSSDKIRITSGANTTIRPVRTLTKPATLSFNTALWEVHFKSQ